MIYLIKEQPDTKEQPDKCLSGIMRIMFFSCRRPENHLHLALGQSRVYYFIPKISQGFLFTKHFLVIFQSFIHAINPI